MLAKGRPDGISRTDVGDLFDRNKEAGEIDRALGTLADAGGLIRRTGTDGRAPGKAVDRTSRIALSQISSLR